MIVGYREKVNSGPGADMEAFDKALALVVSSGIQPSQVKQIRGGGEGCGDDSVVGKVPAKAAAGHVAAAANKNKKHNKKRRATRT